jgi:ABC-type transporter Mla subunit MlaD
MVTFLCVAAESASEAAESASEAAAEVAEAVAEAAAEVAEATAEVAEATAEATAEVAVYALSISHKFKQSPQTLQCAVAMFWLCY